MKSIQFYPMISRILIWFPQNNSLSEVSKISMASFNDFMHHCISLISLLFDKYDGIIISIAEQKKTTAFCLKSRGIF